LRTWLKGDEDREPETKIIIYCACGWYETLSDLSVPAAIAKIRFDFYQRFRVFLTEYIAPESAKEIASERQDRVEAGVVV
jgi:hypothetical protein